MALGGSRLAPLTIRSSEKLDALHELILVGPRNWNLVLIDFDDELERVDVGDPVDVDDEVPADPHKIFLRELEEQIFQAGFDLSLIHI